MLRYLIPTVIGLVVGLLLGGVLAYEWVDNDIERTKVPGKFVYAFGNGMTMKIDTKEDGEFDLTKPLTITKAVKNDRVDVQFAPQIARIGESSNAATDVVVAVSEDDSDQRIMDKLNAIDVDIDALAVSVGKLPMVASAPELQTAARRTEEMQQTLVSIDTAVEKLTTAVNELPESASSTKLKTVLEQTASLVQSIGDINKDVDTLLDQSKDDASNASVQALSARLDEVFELVQTDLKALLVQCENDASALAVQAVITRLNEVRQEIGTDIDVLVTSAEKDIPEVTIHVPEVRPEPIQPAPLVPDVYIYTPSAMSLIGAEGYGLTVPDLERIHTK